MIVDSHCHLNLMELDKYDGGLAGVLQRAVQAQVQHMLCVGTTRAHSEACIQLATDYPQVSASVGIHPNEAHADDDKAYLLAWAKDDRVVAIGETGLDYFRTEADELPAQQAAFCEHIELAKQVNKPLIIHTRQAKEDTLAIMRSCQAEEAGGVLHCFTEDIEMAKTALDMNFYISFSGIITFKNAIELQEVVKAMPMDRILIETDSPYLAPVPFRGKLNEPAYVKHVAEQVASLKGLSFETVAEQTTQNFYQLFNIRQED